MKTLLLGKRIREERQKLNLTQEKLAEDINISTAYMGQIERGERNITLENLITLSNRLGVNVDYLLAESMETNSDNQSKLWLQLMDGRSEHEKAFAVNMVKLMFGYLDNNK